jgi:predicted nucleic acid-binding protein
MYLIETSIWIDYFRNKQNKPIQFFEKLIDSKTPYGITGVIYQEILQGAASLQDYKNLVSYLGSQIFYHPKHFIQTYESAAKLYFDCRRKGITIRSTVDCLIAQIAIEHGLTIIHNDNDYNLIQKIQPNLKLYLC